ncbi:MAG: hypothetical protein LBM78_00340 [Clostridiales bacterium]|jgi:hypothetical protein|nr:hypothetical protein [Clostridiales bacterium]
MKWWPFKRKKKKLANLTREEVVSAMLELDARIESMQTGMEDKRTQIDGLMQKGRAETDTNMRLLLAKKVNMLHRSIKNDLNRTMFMMYNAELLDKLKESIEDNNLMATTDGVSINALLADNVKLAAFLNKSLGRKITAETMFTEADEVFKSVSDAYEPPEEIYGVSAADDELLAMFETQNAVAADVDASSSTPFAADAKADLLKDKKDE